MIWIFRWFSVRKQDWIQCFKQLEDVTVKKTDEKTALKTAEGGAHTKRGRYSHRPRAAKQPQQSADAEKPAQKKQGQSVVKKQGSHQQAKSAGRPRKQPALDPEKQQKTAQSFALLFKRNRKGQCFFIQHIRLQKMKALPWYGNIRELQHAVEKAVILSDGTVIGEDGISGETPLREKPLEEVQTIDEMESRLIGKTIRDCGGNLSQVAAKLGVTRQTLYNKIKKYGL